MKPILFAKIGLSSGILCISASAWAAITHPSPHRKVDVQGVGNCVFSTAKLADQQDSAYALTGTFTAPQSVHARCYFAKAIHEYKSQGKDYNSIRDKNMYWASISVKSDNGSMTRLTGSTYPMNQPESDQHAFTVDGTAENTDFGLRSYPAKFGAKNYRKKTDDYAIDMANYVKAMAHSAKKYPYTANFCIDVYAKVADQSQQETKYDELGQKWVAKNIPLEKDFVIAKGCFDYTIKSADAVSWSPDSTSPDNVLDQTRDLLKGFGYF
jgi:hypothetical protein